MFPWFWKWQMNDVRLTEYGIAENMNNIHQPKSHLSPCVPLSHPSGQLPFTWLHCSPLKQFPQTFVHTIPYVLSLHSVIFMCFKTLNCNYVTMFLYICVCQMINELVSFFYFLLSLHCGPLYPVRHPRQVPSVMSQWPSWQFLGHGKEQVSPYVSEGQPASIVTCLVYQKLLKH